MILLLKTVGFLLMYIGVLAVFGSLLGQLMFYRKISKLPSVKRVRKAVTGTIDYYQMRKLLKQAKKQLELPTKISKK